MMEEHRSAERDADMALRSLSAAIVETIDQRSRALGVKLTMRDEGQIMELVAPVPR